MISLLSLLSVSHVVVLAYNCISELIEPGMTFGLLHTDCIWSPAVNKVPEIPQDGINGDLNGQVLMPSNISFRVDLYKYNGVNRA